MKPNLFLPLLCLLLVSSIELKSQSLCLSDPITKGGKEKFNTSIQETQFQQASAQACKLYWINVYIHRVKGNDYGYSSSIDNTILTNLNSSFNQYGFYFQLSGSRDW